MEIITTPLKGCVIVKAKMFDDDRGYFLESFNKKRLDNDGIPFDVKQINFVGSVKNVLRGLHFQTGAFAQSKFVGVPIGAVLDVVVDIRKNSPSYLQHFKCVIKDPCTYLHIPPGFAHGYKSLKEETIFFYAVNNYYSPENEGGIRFDDPNLRIDWELDVDPILSEKDLNQPYLKSTE